MVNIFALLLLAATSVVSPQSPPAPAEPVELAQMTIEQRIIIRVPMMRRGMPGAAAMRAPVDEDGDRIVWEERKGPRCVEIEKLRAATITGAKSVDLFLDGHRRMRAYLGRACRAADLWSGFYIQPTEDGELCAGRDRVLGRSGADCEIESLKRLVAERH